MGKMLRVFFCCCFFLAHANKIIKYRLRIGAWPARMNTKFSVETLENCQLQYRGLTWLGTESRFSCDRARLPFRDVSIIKELNQIYFYLTIMGNC